MRRILKTLLVRQGMEDAHISFSPCVHFMVCDLQVPNLLIATVIFVAKSLGATFCTLLLLTTKDLR